MIRAILKGAEKDILLLGLSRANIEGLIAGRPILVRKGPLLEFDVERLDAVCIIFGETEEAIAEEIQRQHPEAAAFDLRDPKNVN